MEENKSEEVVEETATEEVDLTEKVKTLEEQLAKVEQEKENYKELGLKYKKEAKEEEEPVWNEDTQLFQKQTLSKAEKMAEEKARQTVENFNEKAGIAKFKELHPDVDIKEILTNYQPKNGKYSAESVVRDLERAHVLHQWDTGKLSGKEAEAEAKGRKKGAAESKLADLNTVSGSPKRAAPEGKALTEGELRIAKMMKVDPQKLAEEDLDQPATIEI